MDATRREIILNLLFGTGHIGLRSLATGLPMAALARSPRAWAQEAYQCAEKSKAQYLILSTSSAGDPLNANVPGTYDFPDIVHAADPLMEPVPLKLGDKTFTAARLWSKLPQWVLDRTCFFHHATLTNNHPNLPKVMRRMGATAGQEMLPSILAKHLAPCHATIQTEPVSVGAGDILTFNGRGLPNINATGLRDTLAQPTGPLKQIQKLRDMQLDRIHASIKRDGTKAQRDYLDRLALSRTQARALSGDLLAMLADIKSDRSDGQILAATALIRMNVSPVVALRIDFGGDNHGDTDLKTAEIPRSDQGVQRIAALMENLRQYGLQDKVTFAMYNVFGRTLKKKGTRGRDHWASHHVTLMIGKPIRAWSAASSPRRATTMLCPSTRRAAAASPAAATCPSGRRSPPWARRSAGPSACRARPSTGTSPRASRSPLLWRRLHP